MVTQQDNKQYEYFAFISYKREDEKWAKWLQRKLEYYKLPSSVRKNNPDLPEKIRPVFKDTTDLEPGVLAQKIQDALNSSKFLIVICSPRSANSVWVSKEVQSFIDSGRADHIIPFIIGGTPNASDPKDECFPEGLRQLAGERELLGTNINEMGRDAAAIKIVARMFNLRFDALWQRYERFLRRKRFIWLIAAMSFVFISIIVIAYLAILNQRINEQRERADIQTALAVKESQRANAERDKVLEVNNELQIANDSINKQTILLEVTNKDLIAKSEELFRLNESLIIEQNNLKEANRRIINQLIEKQSNLAEEYISENKIYKAVDAISEYVKYAEDTIPSAKLLERVLRRLYDRYNPTYFPQILDYYLGGIGNQYYNDSFRDSLLYVQKSQDQEGMYEIVLEDIETHKSGLPIAKIKDNIHRFNYTNFATGNILVTSSDSTLSLMNIYNGVVNFQMPLLEGCLQYVLSEDNKILVLTNQKGVKLYDICSEEYLDSIQFDNSIIEIKQLSATKYLAIATNGIYPFDVSEDRIIANTRCYKSKENNSILYYVVADKGLLIVDNNKLMTFDCDFLCTSEIEIDFKPEKLAFRQIVGYDFHLIALLNENKIQLLFGKNNSYLNLKDIFGDIIIPSIDDNYKYSHKEIMMPNDSTISVVSYGVGLIPTLFRNIRIPNVMNRFSSIFLSPLMSEKLEVAESNVISLYGINGELTQKWETPINEGINKVIYFSETDSIIIALSSANRIYKLSKSGDCKILKIPKIVDNDLITYDPKSHYLAYLGCDKSRNYEGVFVFDVNTLDEIMFISLHDKCYDIKILDFCKTIAFSTGEVIHLFSLQPDENNQIHYDDITLGKGHFFNNFSVSESSKSLAISTMQGQILILRDYGGIGSRPTIQMKTIPENSFVYSTSWSPDGKELLITVANQLEKSGKIDIIIYDVDSWEEREKQISFLPFIYNFFSQDMKYIISSDYQSSLLLPFRTPTYLIKWFTELYK